MTYVPVPWSELAEWLGLIAFFVAGGFVGGWQYQRVRSLWENL